MADSKRKKYFILMTVCFLTKQKVFFFLLAECCFLVLGFVAARKRLIEVSCVRHRVFGMSRCVKYSCP